MNQIGFYLQSPTQNVYGKSFSNNGLYHIKLEYQNGVISYYLNNNVTVTSLEIIVNLLGFNITDWQNDMDITITNFKIDAIP